MQNMKKQYISYQIFLSETEREYVYFIPYTSNYLEFEKVAQYYFVSHRNFGKKNYGATFRCRRKKKYYSSFL